MPGLKKHFPDVRFSGNKVTPDEIDRYEVYSCNLPSTSATWVGTAVGTQTTTPTVGFLSVILDYPRSLNLCVLTATGSVTGGTMVVTGKNQFGVSQTESIAVVSTTTGGTTVGTKVFASVSAAAMTMGSGDPGSGTVSLGVGTTGTTALFGLPVKIGSTADVKLFSWVTNGAQVAVNGGTYGAFVDATNHAIKAPASVTGTSGFSVWIKPSYNAENDSEVTNL